MMLDLFGLAAIITKFSLYLGVLTATGTVMATRIFQLDRTNGLAAAFACLGLIAAIFAFLLRGANLTGDASGMIDPEMLGLSMGDPGWYSVNRACFRPKSSHPRFIPWARWDLDFRVGGRHCRWVFRPGRPYL